METVHTSRSLNFTFAILKCCGYWMPSSCMGNWKAIAYRVFSCFMLMATLGTYVLTECIDIYMNLGDIEKNMETAGISITVMSASYKAMKIITGRQRIQVLMDKLDGGLRSKSKAIQVLRVLLDPNFSCVTKENSKHLVNAMTLSNIFGKSLLFLAVGSSVLWGAFPLFDKSDEADLPFRAWFPWDRSVRSTFITLYVYQVISMDIISVVVTSQDVLMCSIVILICGQLDLLYSEIAAIGDDQTLRYENGKHMDEMSNVEKEKFQERLSEAGDPNLQLRRCILHQKEILSFVEEIENLFSSVIFLQFFGSCIVVCATAFQLSITPFSVKFMSNTLYMSTLLGELFMFCYPGNELMLKSANLSEAAYKTGWYEQDLTFKKMLITLMERSKRPIIVTAGRIMPLTLATLTSILRSSYSYYAVLNTMRAD